MRSYEARGDAGNLVLAAGGHHHAVRILIAAVIVVVIVAALGFTAAFLVRRAHRGRAGDAANAMPRPSGREAPPPGNAAITVGHLTKTYRMGGSKVRALDDVSSGSPPARWPASWARAAPASRPAGPARPHRLGRPAPGSGCTASRSRGCLERRARAELRLRAPGLRVPGVRPAARAHRGRECLPARHDAGAARRPDDRAGPPSCWTWSGWPRAPAPAPRAVRRRAAAGGDRAGAGQPAARDLRRRADGQSGLGVGPDRDADAPEAAGHPRRHRGVRLPRPDDAQYATQLIRLSDGRITDGGDGRRPP